MKIKKHPKTDDTLPYMAYISEHISAHPAMLVPLRPAAAAVWRFTQGN